MAINIGVDPNWAYQQQRQQSDFVQNMLGVLRQQEEAAQREKLAIWKMASDNPGMIAQMLPGIENKYGDDEEFMSPLRSLSGQFSTQQGAMSGFLSAASAPGGDARAAYSNVPPDQMAYVAEQAKNYGVDPAALMAWAASNMTQSDMVPEVGTAMALNERGMLPPSAIPEAFNFATGAQQKPATIQAQGAASALQTSGNQADLEEIAARRAMEQAKISGTLDADRAKIAEGMNKTYDPNVKWTPENSRAPAGGGGVGTAQKLADTKSMLLGVMAVPVAASSSNTDTRMAEVQLQEQKRFVDTIASPVNEIQRLVAKLPSDRAASISASIERVMEVLATADAKTYPTLRAVIAKLLSQVRTEASGASNE